MNVDVNMLIGVVREAFDEVESYYKKAKNHQKWYSMSAHEKTYYERNYQHAEDEISNLCRILRADISRLYTISRLARKWEKKRNWQLCFPAEELAGKILDYIAKDDDRHWSGPYVNYIHWNINQKARKEALK
jgi:hypothetical protein